VPMFGLPIIIQDSLTAKFASRGEALAELAFVHRRSLTSLRTMNLVSLPYAVS